MSISKRGMPIKTLDDWANHAGPKSKSQWTPDRSAMEIARSWLAVTSPRMPPEIEATFARHSAFGTITSWQAEPEARLPFDAFPGEPRNSDLVLYARDEFGEFVIAIEGKADEPFSETVADALAAALERRLANPRSNGVARIEQLAAALLSAKRLSGPLLGQLRYQLLTATAGALRAAVDRNVRRAVLLVHEFKTRLTKDEKHQANEADLGRFVDRLSAGAITRVEPGILYGPLTVPGAPILTTSVPPPVRRESGVQLAGPTSTLRLNRRRRSGGLRAGSRSLIDILQDSKGRLRQTRAVGRSAKQAIDEPRPTASKVAHSLSLSVNP